MQAAGLSGHLPLFWGDVENSSWVGGTADTGLHERTPYWLNGFVPLAFQLGDPDLISMVSLPCLSDGCLHCMHMVSGPQVYFLYFGSPNGRWLVGIG